MVGVSVVPYVVYDDAHAAIEFLCDAFGFSVRLTVEGADGIVSHAELVLGDGVLMLSSTFREAGYRSPSDFDGVHGQVWCEVGDADAHYSCALAAGAIVIGPPADREHGFRTYRAVDPEGHRWIFASRVR